MFICEVGLNHLGNEEYAIHYINEVIKTDADAITFQILKDSFYADDKYRHLQLPREFYLKASELIRNGQKQFGVAIDDETQIAYMEELGVSFYKILSKDIKNERLIDCLLERTNKKIFVSTGMSDFKEIDSFYSYIHKHKERIVLVHTQLTHEIRDVNLKVVKSLSDRYSLPIAFGNHCANQAVIYLALAYGPADIFVYVKGDLKGNYPDDEHAVFLGDLPLVAINLKALPMAIGEGEKLKMKDWAKG